MPGYSRPISKVHFSFNFYNYLKDNLDIDISTLVKEKVFKKGDYVYQVSTRHDSIYEIIQGSVKLGGYSELGKEYVYDVLQHKDFFGNLKYLSNEFQEFSKAIVDTQMRIYDLSFFKKMIIENPVVSEWFISYIVQRWCNAEKKLGTINEKGTIEKIKYLQRFFNITIQDINDESYLLFDLLTQKDLGDLIGASRQAISKALKSL